jgi:hypothetical protein
MERDDFETPMLFRVWGRQRELFALMPTVPGTYEPHTCTSYAPVGQHGSADPGYCMRKSRPATPAEYAGLKTELEGFGYQVRVIQRTSRRHFDARRAELASIN